MDGRSDFLVIFVFFISVAAYFLPAIIASSRNHPSSVAIMMLNLFLGWTFLGWVAAMVWAFVTPAQVESQVDQGAPDKISQLEKLASLKESGALTSAEYESEKSKLLQS